MSNKPDLQHAAQVCWAGPHTLATATDRDSTLQLMQLDTDDNYVLDVSRAEFARADSDREVRGSTSSAAGITALAYEPRQQTLAATTAEGKVFLYKSNQGSTEDESASEPFKQWDPQQSFQVRNSTYKLHLRILIDILLAYSSVQPVVEQAQQRPNADLQALVAGWQSTFNIELGPNSTALGCTECRWHTHLHQDVPTPQGL